MMASLFFFNDTATTEIYTLSLHDALPIFRVLPLEPVEVLQVRCVPAMARAAWLVRIVPRSEEHTSELQSLAYLVCRLLLEKKKQSVVLSCLRHLQITITGSHTHHVRPCGS